MLIDNKHPCVIMQGMDTFQQLTKSGLVQSLRVIGEPATISGKKFTAAFDDSQMDVNRHVYGDEDDITTDATCLKSALTNTPRINDVLVRVSQKRTYIITNVQDDVESYQLTMREKNA